MSIHNVFNRSALIFESAALLVVIQKKELRTNQLVTSRQAKLITYELEKGEVCQAGGHRSGNS
jgi:hypothetical protein